MKLLMILISLLWITIAFTKTSDFYSATFLEVSDAKKKWGSSSFDAKKFNSATEKEKGSMAVNAIEKNIYVGQDMAKVRKEIGDPNSYFFSDTIYAYKITSVTKANTESWHLIFIPDENLEKVKEVKIHKKCCYPTPPWVK